MKNLIEGEQVP